MIAGRIGEGPLEDLRHRFLAAADPARIRTPHLLLRVADQLSDDRRAHALFEQTPHKGVAEAVMRGAGGPRAADSLPQRAQPAAPFNYQR